MSAGYTGHKPPNGGTADEQELQEALRLSMEVKNDAPNGTGSQSNSTTEVGGTQSRSTVSADEFANCSLFVLRLLPCNTPRPLPSPRYRRSWISLERNFHSYC